VLSIEEPLLVHEEKERPTGEKGIVSKSDIIPQLATGPPQPEAAPSTSSTQPATGPPQPEAAPSTSSTGKEERADMKNM